MERRYFNRGALICTLLIIFFSFSAFAQVGIGTIDPNPNAKLDIVSTAAEPGGLLLPRVELAALNDISPFPGPLPTDLEGMTVYNTVTAGAGVNRVTPGFYYHNSITWVRISGGLNKNWLLEGNAGTTAGADFLGTTDNVNLQFKTNNLSRFEISNGNEANGGRLRSFVNGTAAAPTYSWSLNVGTGMFQQTANVLGFSTGGVERFRIPNANQVHGLNNGSASFPFYSWASNSRMGMYGAGANILAFSTNATERMRIIAGGNVGVNTGASLWTDTAFTTFAIGNNNDAIAGSSGNGLGIYGQSINYVGVQGLVNSFSAIAGVVGSNTASSRGDGVWGLTTLGQDGVYGEKSSGVGNGVHGSSSNVGVRGYGGNGAILESGLGAGYGAIAWNTAASGDRVGLLALGQNLNPVTFAGTGAILYGRESGGAGFAANNNGTGLIGVGNNITTAELAANGSGVAGTGSYVGVFGQADRVSDGIGVIGLGNNLGAYTIPPNGAGVAGTGVNIGVYGHATDASGYGVYSSGNMYVDGIITTTNPIIAPRGIITDGLAVADGNIATNGTFTAQSISTSGDLTAGGVKNFVIDDPRDPANKFLKHASIESNEILNLYRGVDTFDASGEVVVKLPDYYEAINKNASYQLTPIGAAMILYIEKEVNMGSFVIAGGLPGKKVSWTLTAERNDPYIRNNPETRNMEVDKGSERGLYLAPEAYGQPAEKGIVSSRLSEMQTASRPAIENRIVVSQEMQSQTAEARKLNRDEVQNLTMPFKEVKDPEVYKRINNKYKPQGNANGSSSKEQNSFSSDLQESESQFSQRQSSNSQRKASETEVNQLKKED